jgi:hypothetical protein
MSIKSLALVTSRVSSKEREPRNDSGCCAKKRAPARDYVRVSLCLCSCMCVFICACTCVCVRVCLLVCVRVYLCVCDLRKQPWRETLQREPEVVIVYSAVESAYWY